MTKSALRSAGGAGVLPHHRAERRQATAASSRHGGAPPRATRTGASGSNAAPAAPNATNPGAALGVNSGADTGASLPHADHSVAPPHPRRRHAPVEDTDEDDFLPTYHKLDFPKFDGTGDLLSWLNRCEHYFYVRHTPTTSVSPMHRSSGFTT
jgi:hypothetical protein